MKDTVTHVAGPVVSICGRVIQRCAVCGEKLLDNLNTAAPINRDGTAPTFPTWAEGDLIHCHGQSPRSASSIGSFANSCLPDDFCLELVEE